MDRRKLSSRYRVLPYSTALNYARNRHRSRSIDFYVDKRNDSVRSRGRGHKRSRSIVVTGTWSSVYFARKSFASDSITSSAARCGFAFRGFSMSRESSGAHRFGLVLARPCPSVTVSNRRNEATSRGKIVATPHLESRPSPTLAESFSINWSMWNCYILFVFMFPFCLKYYVST